MNTEHMGIISVSVAVGLVLLGVFHYISTENLQEAIQTILMGAGIYGLRRAQAKQMRQNDEK